MQEIFDTTLVTVFNTMVIPGIYWIGLESLLKNKKWFSILRIISLFFILTGIILSFLIEGSRQLLGTAVSFIFPFYHLWLYRILRNYFITKENREPIDTAFNWKSGLGKDRAFALFFVLFSIFSSFIIIGIITWNSNNVT